MLQGSLTVKSLTLASWVFRARHGRLSEVNERRKGITWFDVKVSKSKTRAGRSPNGARYIKQKSLCTSPGQLPVRT